MIEFRISLAIRQEKVPEVRQTLESIGRMIRTQPGLQAILILRPITEQQSNDGTALGREDGIQRLPPFPRTQDSSGSDQIVLFRTHRTIP
jgi:hypothetical protein